MSALAPPARTRVLVVDDSAFARKVIREVLSAAPDIDVVGIARDGLDALEKITALTPDVVTLDLMMPELDGLGVLHALRGDPPLAAPAVVVVTMSDAESDVAIEALEAGAVEIVQKPTALATDRLYELRDELLAKVRVAALTRRRPEVTAVASASEAALPSASATRVVAIGASTGGPSAIARLLRDLPGTLAAPLVIAVHMPPGYTHSLARRLDGMSALDVLEAYDGLVLRRGLAVIARGGAHLTIDANGACAVAYTPIDRPYRPSIDVLFESAARAYGAGVLGVVLTGMGDDGVLGARAIHAAGGALFGEAESTCVVYGMPRALREAALGSIELPLHAIPGAIARHVAS